MPSRIITHPGWVRRTCVAAAIASVVICVAACGSSSSSSSPSSSSGASSSTPAASTGSGGSSSGTVTIGAVPSLSTLVVLVAQKEGMFAKAGLPNVKFSLIGTPTNSYPELLANKIQVLDGTATTTIGFNANGAPVNIVAGGEVEDTTAQNEWFKVLALKSSHITNLKQLVGKKVAVGQLNSLGTLDLSGALLKEGLSPTAIHFVALPFPNQLAALKSGEVAAMWQGEPYVTQSLATGTTNVVCGCGYIAQPEVPVGSMTMTTTYETAHPEVAAAIRKVYPEAVKYIQTHPTEARALAKSSLGVSSYTAAHLQLPTYVTPYPLASFHGLEKLELKLGYIKKIPPDSSVLALK